MKTNWLHRRVRETASVSLAVALIVLTQVPPASAQSTRLPKVAAGPTHGLIVLPSGVVRAFGRNEQGELGRGGVSNPDELSPPVDVPGINDAVDAAAQGNASYVLRADGSVLAWGDNSAGQLGLGAPGVLPKSSEVFKPVLQPTPVAGLVHVRQLAANPKIAMALLDDGTVRAWGFCGAWKLDGVPGSGSDDGFRVPFPARVFGLAGVKAVAIGGEYALAVLNDGTVKAWGRNNYGQIGDEQASRSATPVAVPGLHNIVAVSAGLEYALALQDNGTVWVWGDGGEQQTLNNFAGVQAASVHLGTHSWSAQPIAIPRLRDVVAISAGAAAVALLKSGNVRAWSYNGFYAMGLGHGTEYPRGLQVPRVSDVAAIATGLNATYFVQRDGTVLATGAYPAVRRDDFPRVPTVILTKEQAASAVRPPLKE